MRRMGCLLTLFFLAAATCTLAAEVRPGDQVRLIEREQHIPAHPAPGDSRVSLRLVSGSQATVLAINATTGWLEVRGEPVEGTANTGWIPPAISPASPGRGSRRRIRSPGVRPKARPRRTPVAGYGWPPGISKTSMPRMGNPPIPGRTRR
jgi:hypothetical protein